MCFQEPSSPSSPEPTNTEPINLNSEPQPPPEPASESRKRPMPEPYTPEPTPKPTPKPKRHGVSSSTSTPSSPPPSSSTPLQNPVESTEDFVEDMFQYLPMPLEELNRQSPSHSTLPPPPPISDDLLKFLPASLFDELEPLNMEPLNTILPIQVENDLIPESVGKDWTPPFAKNIDDRISALADPIFTNEPMDIDYLDSWFSPTTKLRSAVVSHSINYVPVDHDGNTDVPVPTPRSRFVVRYHHHHQDYYYYY